MNTQLKNRSDLHVSRKVWHFCGVILIAIAYHNVERALGLQILTLVTFLNVWLEVYRRKSESFNNFLIRNFGSIMRESERRGLAGTTYLLFGVLTIVAIFPKSVVMLSLFFLAIADPIASYFGVKYGRDRLFGRKSLQGTLAAFFVCLAISMGYFVSHSLMTERLLIVSVLAGLIGAFSEAVPIGKLDDNFVLPVLSSCLLWCLFFLFGGL